MSKRTRARQVALQMLYQVDLNPELAGREVMEQIREQLEDFSQASFARTLFGGVMETRDELDEAISAHAKNWSLHRMAATDRNIVRMGAFELRNLDTPHKVVINECVELAKKFGDKDSGGFVNGMLDKLVPDEKRAPRAGAPVEEPVEDQPESSSSTATINPQLKPKKSLRERMREQRERAASNASAAHDDESPS